jgi:hypothetical protein
VRGRRGGREGRSQGQGGRRERIERKEGLGEGEGKWRRGRTTKEGVKREREMYKGWHKRRAREGEVARRQALDDVIKHWCYQYANTFHCSRQLCCNMIRCDVLYCDVMHYTVLHSTAQHCTALYCTALHCTVLYRTALSCASLLYECHSPAFSEKEKDNASLLSLTAIGVTSACTVTVLWYWPFTTQENVDLCFPSTLLQNIISNPA